MGRRLLIALLLNLSACGGQEQTGGEPAPTPSPDPSPVAVAAMSNGSIMRPSVVKEAQQAEPAPAPPQPIRATVGFSEGSARLNEEARAGLDRLVAQPSFARLGPVTLRGHTDSVGSDRANLAVSRSRAEAVRDYLVEKGVSEDRIKVVALGERRPVAPNAELDGSDSEEGRRRNRRVEIEVDVRAVTTPERNVSARSEGDGVHPHPAAN